MIQSKFLNLFTNAWFKNFNPTPTPLHEFPCILKTHLALIFNNLQ